VSARVGVRRERVAHPGRQGGHVEGMQRRRLSLAMVEVVSEEGFEGATIARVCRRAGVSRRTFYEIFDDREQCLLATFDQAIEHLTHLLKPIYTSDGSWCERTRNSLMALLEIFDNEPDLARMCVVETLKTGPILSERRAQVIAGLVQLIEQGRSEAKRGNQPPPLAGQGVVGGVLSIVHAHLLERSPGNGVQHPLIELTGPLMSMIVHPYLGSAAARRELRRPVSKTPATAMTASAKDPFKDLSIRFTYRTARVLATIATNTGASNRLVAEEAGISDEGQTSRLLTRLDRAGLIENSGDGRLKGEANAWALTERGVAVHTALTGH
jgi:AcrR family transcriptional regulator